jgi:hypothetical protein
MAQHSPVLLFTGVVHTVLSLEDLMGRGYRDHILWYCGCE